MARNGSGAYSLPAGNPVVTGTAISSTVHNNTMSDIATALTGSLARDGQSPPTANLPMGGFKLTGLASGSDSTDSATLSQAVNARGTVPLASASTVNIGAELTSNIAISGTTTITAFDTVAEGVIRAVVYTGAVPITYNATSMQLFNAVSRTNAAGDVSIFKSLGSGNWKELAYIPNAATSARATIGAAGLTGRQRLINGNFAVNQIPVAGTVTLAAGEYGHDGWKAGASGCTYTFAASGIDTVITITAGSLMQVVEAKKVEGGVYRLSHSGTAQARIAVNGASTTGSYAATPLSSASATANQKVTVEFTTGTLDRVQLEPGTLETNFERIDYDEMLRRCKRYYQLVAISASGFASGTVSVGGSFPVEMYAAPTMVRTGDVFTASEAGTTFTAANTTIFYASNTSATAVGGRATASARL